MSFTLRPLHGAVLLIFACAAAASAQEQTTPPPVYDTSFGQDVTLLPGDMIGLKVFGAKDMPEEFLVDERGIVTLPFVGPRKVTDIPLGQLRDQLLAAFAEELTNPALEITPLRRVYVLGEVNAPGLYPVDMMTPLAGAIALAEGPTADGDPNKIRVLRDGKVLLDNVRAESILATTQIRSGDQIFVQPRSWTDRNPTFIPNVVTSLLTSVIITFLARL